ncbi:MAG: hypothetical protein AAF152_04640 [Cyanobacteria bacterium P01_A01_bin.114]
MKVSRIVACASLLAVAGQAKAAQAEVPYDQVKSVDQAKEELRQAICYQDWNKASEIASLIIASSAITPEYRQSLVDWRYRFSNYSDTRTKFERIPNCEGVAPPPPPSQRLGQIYPSDVPQFSAYTSDPGYACYITYSNGQTVNLARLCGSAANGEYQIAAKGSKTAKYSGGYELNIDQPGY